MTDAAPAVDAIDPYVPGRGNPGYVVTGYELDLDYAITTNRLEGHARITAEALEELPRLSLDLLGLRISKVAVDGAPARASQRNGKVHVTPARPVPAGAAFAVDVRYAGRPGPTRSTWGPVGWEELTDGVLVAAQPCGAATWFPCNDLARQKAPMRTSISVASSYCAVANGRLVSRQAKGNRTTWTYEQAEPTSPYLATIHVGRYERRELASEPVPVHAVVPPEHRRSFGQAFARQGEMLEVFEHWFGPYPFEAGYTVVVSADELELPLEAQGQSIFGTNHLDGASERLIAHELAHQWFGNSVTASRWQDIWLHEGFACYSEWIWSEAAGGPTAHELAEEHHERLRSLPQDLLLADPGARDLFDDRVYKRGALTLHALRLELGDEPFRRLLRAWTSTHQHGTVTTDDFVALAGSVADRSYADHFAAWLHRRPLPPLSG